MLPSMGRENDSRSEHTVGYCWRNAFGEKFQSTAAEILVQMMLKRLKRPPILNSPTVSRRIFLLVG